MHQCVLQWTRPACICCQVVGICTASCGQQQAKELIIAQGRPPLCVPGPAGRLWTWSLLPVWACSPPRTTRAEAGTGRSVQRGTCRALLPVLARRRLGASSRGVSPEASRCSLRRRSRPFHSCRGLCRCFPGCFVGGVAGTRALSLHQRQVCRPDVCRGRAGAAHVLRCLVLDALIVLHGCGGVSDGHVRCHAAG